MKNIILNILVFAIGGVILLSAFSTIQKLIIGSDFSVQGYLIPVFFGASTGIILWYFNYKRNITENILKTKENKLSKEHAINKALFDNVLIGITIWDKKGNILSANKVFTQITGYTKEEVKNLDNWFEIAYPEPEYRNKVINDWNKSTSKSQSTKEFQIQTKDKKIKHIEFRGNFLDDGKAIVTLSDITEKKEAADAAIKMRDRLLSVFNAADGIPIQAYNEDRSVTFWNKASEKVYGYKQNEALGKKLEELIIPEKMQERVIIDHYNWIHKGVEIPSSTLTLKNKEGEDVEVYSSHVMIDNPNGFKEMFCIDLDISNLKKTKEKLINREKYYETLFESAHDAIFIMDSQSFISCNVSTLRVFGYKEKKEILGKSPWMISPEYQENGESSSEEAKRQIREAINKGFNDFEWLHKRKDGSVFNALVSLNKLKIKGKIYLQAIVRDISERKTNELKLKTLNQELNTQNAQYQKINEELIKANNDLKFAKEKAEESDRLKSAFLANMSHEIRTPMNGIVGFTDLLKNQKVSEERRQHFLSLIQRGSKRMLNTINDIIDISKIESGQMEIIKSNIEINKELTDIYSFYKNEAKDKNLELNFNSKIDDSEKINTDKQKFNAIITNLLKNAIKYTDKGSIYLNCKKTDKEIIFEVKDTGIGIPEHKKSAIFKRFVQADPEDVDAREGSGLGLSISKAYAEMMGGTIEVESKQNQGSAFTFKLLLTNVKPGQ